MNIEKLLYLYNNIINETYNSYYIQIYDVDGNELLSGKNAIMKAELLDLPGIRIDLTLDRGFLIRICDDMSIWLLINGEYYECRFNEEDTNIIIDYIERCQELYDYPGIKPVIIDVLNDLKLSNINESSISPLRFKDSNLSDILDFIDELLYNTKGIDITEKIAGQHLTINIKNNFVTVNTKDSLLYNTGDKNAKHTKYGSELTKVLIKYLESNKLPDQTWNFEIVNPKFNHDYINYSNKDIIFIEYSGNLTDNIANDLRKYLSIRLLTKSDIKINITKNNFFDDFKREWETTLKSKYTSLNTNNKSKYYYHLINDLKYKIGELLENILTSIVDKQSPIEGIVIGTKTPIKLQTNSFLTVQKIQMPMFSLFKIDKAEIQTVLDNPLTPFKYLKQNYNLELNSIYKGDLDKSLYDIVKTYLEKNKYLTGVNTSKYKIWLTETESNDLLNKLTKNNISQIYKDIYNKVK